MLASFLKCIGHIIPLMDAVYANYYTREVMFILVREFQTPDEEMKKIVLKVVQQCVATEGVEPQYIRTDIMAPFFANFWVRRMALDRRNYRALVDTTVSLANKVRPCGWGLSCHLLPACCSSGLTRRQPPHAVLYWSILAFLALARSSVQMLLLAPVGCC